MFKKFHSITGDAQSTKYLAAEHLPFTNKDLPSQKLFYYSNFARIPFHILALLCVFVLFGLMNMYSISLTKGAMYFNKFSIFWLLSTVILFVVPMVNLRYFLKFSYLIYIAAVLSLFGVFVIGDVSMGARRWIDLGFMKIQPSEFVKIAVVFALARYYHFIKSFTMHSLFKAGIALLIAAVPAGLTMIQPDLGSGLVIIFITLLMVFVNGIRWHWLVIAFFGFCALTPVVWGKLHDYQKDRILTFINPERDPRGAGYNVIQSKIAIGSGGIFGKGYTQNDQSSLQFLPENQTDFAFTVFAEEFGFMGSILLILCFVYLIMYGNILAQKCKNYFGKMLAFGVTSLLFVHICVNLMMIMGLLPVVGIPLPFISYGGSSLMLCVFCVALLINVDIHRNIIIHSTVRTYMLK
jgi:rod shape determining protein RodA